MTSLISTKPYMVRAINEWCVDSGLTPHLLVAVNQRTRVPMAYVKNGEIVLNINYSATKDLHIDNEAIVFSARFGGVSQNLYVPMDAVKGIFARENGQGMFFEVEQESQATVDLSETDRMGADSVTEEKNTSVKAKPTLKIVK
ncbi:MAG TPA: ClpXP protease specificity-enhancing factor [Methylophilaceae bacterium]|nr:ClpXP protease specificity-enhancing factor [Methylophilaceae bacterium]HAJ72132.1 ClpXP protease specificity-enhancing factor [Methylophilaceae bacterium]